MANIIVFQHSEIGLPGRIGMTLRDHGLCLDIRRADLHESEGAPFVPEDFDNVHGVVSLGGPQDVGGPHPWMRHEIEFLRAAHERELPVFGICLGAQLLAAALGAEVGRADKPELGYHPVRLNPMGQTDIMLAGIAWESQQFQMHWCEIKSTPPGATLLASSDQCEVQCFRAGISSYGFQWHPEADRTMIEAFTSSNADDLAKAGVSADDLARQSDAHYAEFARLSDRLALNIATYAFPSHQLLRV